MIGLMNFRDYDSVIVGIQVFHRIDSAHDIQNLIYWFILYGKSV